jgi:methionine-rich copper-binding protein CopC
VRDVTVGADGKFSVATKAAKVPADAEVFAKIDGRLVGTSKAGADNWIEIPAAGSTASLASPAPVVTVVAPAAATTSALTLMRKAFMAAVLGSLIMLVSPAPAYAHADFTRSTPANGSTVAKAPSAIRITFNEPVTIDSAKILDASGSTVPSSSAMNGAVLILTPASPLRAGITTAEFSVTSDDGHQVDGAIAFIIGKPGARGTAQSCRHVALRDYAPQWITTGRPDPHLREQGGIG